MDHGERRNRIQACVREVSHAVGEVDRCVGVEILRQQGEVTVQADVEPRVEHVVENLRGTESHCGESCDELGRGGQRFVVATTFDDDGCCCGPRCPDQSCLEREPDGTPCDASTAGLGLAGRALDVAADLFMFARPRAPASGSLPTDSIREARRAMKDHVASKSRRRSQTHRPCIGRRTGLLHRFETVRDL